MSEEFWAEMFAAATVGESLDLSFYSKRPCAIATCKQVEMMHKDDLFCKKCKRSGKNEEPIVYNVHNTNTTK